MRQIVGYIDTRMEQVAASIPEKDFEKTCILTSLNLAAELLTLKDKITRTEARLERLLDTLGSQPQ